MNLNNNLAEMREANRRMRLLLDSIGQAILIFGPDGICQSEHSAICEEVFEVQPSGVHISKILKIPESEKKSFNDWIHLVFTDFHDFEELVALAPQFSKNSHGKWISLEYREVRDKEDSLTGIVLVATDKTAEQRAQKDLKKQIENAEQVERILRYKSQFCRYVRYLFEKLMWLSQISTDKDLQGENLDEIRRTLHNLKGTTGSFFLNSLVDIIHQAENILATYSETPNFTHLREFRFYVSEMENYMKKFLVDYEFLLGKEFGRQDHIAETRWSDLKSVYHELVKAQVPNDLTTLYLKKLMSKPISKCLNYLNSSLQVAVKKSGKRCFPIVFKGGEIPTIEEQYSGLFHAFTHFTNNAAKYGIEPPAHREILGKPVSGQIKIISRLVKEDEQTWLHILFIDDGQGITAEVVRKKMKQKGKAVPKDWSDDKVLQLIFEPDFSTSEKVDHLSGRGVGLNAVWKEVEKLGGHVSVSSEKGKGTTFTIKVPYIICYLPGLHQEEETAA